MDKKKILLVDDEEDVLKTVGFRLQASGYDVVTASDGKEGLEKARSEKPDLVILDLMLPKMDGYKVCAFLKKDTRYKDIPIIMFTAKAGDIDKKLGLEVGADAYIMKPFEPPILVETVEKLLAKNNG
ncbi:MAG: response regulator [Candidatus Omnitrophica bacterium]|nr:response regulator [Candidatus Omnitrophota bacterium]MDD5736931.1 response regulator [Candidatus Omnitrophota bacterium]